MYGIDIVNRAKELGSKCVYWYGGKMERPTVALANRLRKAYPTRWTDSYYDTALADIGSGKLVCDCSGLVCAAYQIPNISTYKMLDRFAAYNGSTYIPGMIGWKLGHCGIILDSAGHIAEMRGSKWDVRTNRTFNECGFTQILYDPKVTYEDWVGNWRKAGDYWQYQKAPNALACNEFLKINGSWYYFNAKCNMVTGYFKIGNKRYCSSENGLLKSANETSTELSAYELIH